MAARVRRAANALTWGQVGVECSRGSGPGRRDANGANRSDGPVRRARPASWHKYWSVPHIKWLPIDDMRPLSFALIWRTEAENDLIRALAQTVRDLGPLTL